MKKDKIRAKYECPVEGTALRIPPKAKYDRKLSGKKLRVVAYCRVSTGDDDQATSFEAQKKHFEDFIGNHNDWEFVRIYADEGISGTSTKRRDAFNQMIKDARAGEFDMIITKNVSRFTRNVVDGLTAARELLHQDPPIGIYFEEDKFDTLMPNSEFLLTIMLSLAQGESAKKSETMQTAYKWRNERNDFYCPTRFLLGYITDEEGDMVIEPEGAKTIRAIYTMYLAGVSATEIARTLTDRGRPTGKDNLVWSGGSVMNILRNERYCGDIIAQKSYVVDFLEHKRAKNEGQKWIYYMANHHEGIVTREEYVRALLLSNANRQSRYFNPEYEMRVIHEGLLTGFIPVNCAFGGYEAGHYLAASASVPPMSDRRRAAEILHIEGCEVALEQALCGATAPAVTLSAKWFRFSKECTALLPGTEYVELLIHPGERLLSVRKTNARNKDAIPWCDGSISSAAFLPILFEICGWHSGWNYRSPAVCLSKKTERVLLFDLGATETIIRESEDGKRTSRRYLPTTWLDSFGTSMPGSYASCRRHLAISLSNWQTNAPALPVSGFETTIEIPDEGRIQAVLRAMEAAA